MSKRKLSDFIEDVTLPMMMITDPSLFPSSSHSLLFEDIIPFLSSNEKSFWKEDLLVKHQLRKKKKKKFHIIRPPIDFQENNKEIIIKVDLPGVSKSHVKVDFNEESHMIRIYGDFPKKKKASNEEETFLSQERPYGKFLRSIHLPEHLIDNLKVDEMKAKLEHGILNVTVPKKQEEEKEKKSNTRIIPIE
ncbi:hypothetical protein ABK040_002685 [Willaertia magna]